MNKILTPMLTLLSIKKKLTEEKVANIFTNYLFRTVDECFPEVASIINNDPEFEKSPNISVEDSDKFLLIVLAGNIKYIPEFCHNYQDVRLIDLILQKCSRILEVEKEELKATIGSYQQFMMKENFPSKNTLYAMSKGFFFKYNLFSYQEAYFRNKKVPNPLFLKRLNEVMANFIWDWEIFLEKYRIVE